MGPIQKVVYGRGAFDITLDSSVFAVSKHLASSTTTATQLACKEVLRSLEFLVFAKLFLTFFLMPRFAGLYCIIRNVLSKNIVNRGDLL